MDGGAPEVEFLSPWVVHHGALAASDGLGEILALPHSTPALTAISGQ